jgi:uncharacterized protein YndB with AHSA1/START domain
MGASKQVSTERVIAAPAEAIFDVLADASRHAEIDGSGMVVAVKGDAQRLAMGAKFGMSMKQGMPYRVKNTVCEFEANQQIAWHHFAGHRWRYVLEPTTLADGQPATKVTETFDWSTAKMPMRAIFPVIGIPKKNLAGMVKTLEILDRVVTGSSAGS